MRKAAGSLPEVDQDGASYTVRGRTFTALTTKGSAVDLHLPPMTLSG